MSIARRVTVRRLLGTGAASLALCAASASGAWATGSPGGGDGWGAGARYNPGTGAGTVTESDRCEFSLDGANFQPSVKVDDVSLRPTDDGKVHIKVRAAGDATTCTASLASYLAHGATFATSGEQKFVDFDTATVKPGRTESLDIAVPDAGCFAQIDLYRGAVKFDGLLDAGDGFEHGELPKGPDRPVIKDKLIAAWNGGTNDCTTAPSEPPATTPPSPTPPATTPPESAEPSTPAGTTPSETEPAAEPPSSESPSTPPPNAPSPAGPGEDLAETGADSNTTPIALGAAALLAGGAAIVIATRRRRSSGS